MRRLILIFAVIAVWLFPVSAATAAEDGPRGSVIFLHPDGMSAATWAAARNLLVGPDGDLHWDHLPRIALYRGHMADSLTATSNGGGTTHAYGVKVASSAYGRSAGGPDGAHDLVDAAGRSLSVAHQAMRMGLPVGIVQSGTSTEPGTGCFLVRIDTRKDHDGIALQLVESGAEVMLGGGEQYYLPEGVEGVHGPGVRKDGRNLIDEAAERGYTVVRTREELRDLPRDAERVLGLFAAGHTFNDQTEEDLADQGLPLYDPDAPSVAEMTHAALRILDRTGRRFLLVVEEEGTDNFGNKNNAQGVLEAARRADEAIGVARKYLHHRPQTLVMVAADSDAGGMRLVGIPMPPGAVAPTTLPERDVNGAPMDGRGGTGGPPFMAAPDAAGRSLPFAITWAAQDDVTGGVLVRGEGLHAELIRGNMDNTHIAKLIRLTLFGRQVPQ